MAEGEDVLLNILKMAAFLGSLYIALDWKLWSWSMWLVGPIFGGVVVIWQAKSLADLGKLRGLLFVFLATLIYVFLLPFGVPGGRWLTPNSADFFPGIQKFILAPALVGAVFLPLAHKVVLGASLTRVRVGIPCLWVAYYSIGLLLFEVLEIGKSSMIYYWPISPTKSIPFSPSVYARWINSVSLWQVIYLVCMFAPLPKFVGRFPAPSSGTLESPEG